VQHRTVVEDLDDPISWDELLSAVSTLANSKSPGLSEFLSDTFKAISGENLKAVHAYFKEYWEDETEFTEWHKG